VTRIRGAVLSTLVGVATILVLVAIGIAPFFTPLWIYPGQDRAQAEAWTGWPAATVHQVTGEVLVDLLIGPPRFDQTVDGQPVFTEAEASHLRDVRRVVLAFAVVAVASVAVLIAARALLPRRRFWDAVATGAKVMAVGVVALGILSVVAFDAAFELFHRLFFAAGTYSFDPATSRLVQLFPEAFWSETAIAIGIVLLVLAVATLWYATRAAHRPTVADAGMDEDVRAAGDRRIEAAVASEAGPVDVSGPGDRLPGPALGQGPDGNDPGRA
jgi:integral membrane protein (TIGR01906 family)